MGRCQKVRENFVRICLPFISWYSTDLVKHYICGRKWYQQTSLVVCVISLWWLWVNLMSSRYQNIRKATRNLCVGKWVNERVTRFYANNSAPKFRAGFSLWLDLVKYNNFSQPLLYFFLTYSAFFIQLFLNLFWAFFNFFQLFFLYIFQFFYFTF